MQSGERVTRDKLPRWNSIFSPASPSSQLLLLLTLNTHNTQRTTYVASYTTRVEKQKLCSHYSRSCKNSLQIQANFTRICSFIQLSSHSLTTYNVTTDIRRNPNLRLITSIFNFQEHSLLLVKLKYSVIKIKLCSGKLKNWLSSIYLRLYVLYQ